MAAALRETKPGTAWVVATGALTNAAALFIAHPDLAEHVKGFSAMGGSIGGGFTPAPMGKVDGVVHDVHMPEHLQVRELLDVLLHAQRRDEAMVRVQVGDDLEAALERDDLPLDVLLQDTSRADVSTAGERSLRGYTYACSRIPISW